MKMYKLYSFKRKLLVLAGSFLFILSGYSQSNRKSVSSEDSITISPDSIPELGFFIDKALSSSPLLASTEEETKKILEEIKIEKSNWLNYIYLEGNTRYGLFNQLTLTEVSGSSDLDAKLSNNTQLNYYGGLAFRIPIADFVQRPKKLRMLNAELSISANKREAQRKEVISLIIGNYYTLMTSKEMFNTYQDIVQTVNISYLKSKSDLNAGIITLEQFSDIVQSKGKVEEIYIKAKNDFLSDYFQLLLLSGIRIK